MKIANSIAEVRKALVPVRQDGRRIGFVPTMGYLHAGHLSLFDVARDDCDYLVTSIFVNPAQFGKGEDYRNYPGDLERDARLSEEHGVDLLFVPPVEEMYPEPPLTQIDVRELTESLCGASRPGHFNGVLLVVAKLFNIVQPALAVFGQKDLQQALAVRRMVKDLNFPLEIRIAPTVRDPDGVALSSRNSYLSPSEREQATALNQALQRARELVESGERRAARLVEEMRSVIREVPSAEIDYIAVVDADRLREIETLNGQVVLALAVRIGKARLIDNTVLQVN